MKEVILTRGQVALVSDEDYEMVNQFKWCAHLVKGVYYAERGIWDSANKKVINVKMHRFIMNVTDSKTEVDHQDRNTLNNQRNNLRVATRSQNTSNKTSAKNSSSIFVGVGWHKGHEKWQAKIWKTDKRHHLGYFENEIDAALAYNNAARKLHGEFANLNIIP